MPWHLWGQHPYGKSWICHWKCLMKWHPQKRIGIISNKFFWWCNFVIDDHDFIIASDWCIRCMRTWWIAVTLNMVSCTGSNKNCYKLEAKKKTFSICNQFLWKTINLIVNFYTWFYYWSAKHPCINTRNVNNMLTACVRSMCSHTTLNNALDSQLIILQLQLQQQLPTKLSCQLTDLPKTWFTCK